MEVVEKVLSPVLSHGAPGALPAGVTVPEGNLSTSWCRCWLILAALLARMTEDMTLLLPSLLLLLRLLLRRRLGRRSGASWDGDGSQVRTIGPSDQSQRSREKSEEGMPQGGDI